MRNYDLERNTHEAENLIAHIEAMRKHASFIMEYCTHECAKCPMSKQCDWDGFIDYTDKSMADIEKFVDFLEYYDRVQAKREAEADREEADAWIAANRWAGIDPSWATVIPTGRI